VGFESGLSVAVTFGTAVLLLSAVATGGVYVFARRHLLDAPGNRSSHVRPTPRGGGAGPVAAFLTGTLAYAAVMGWPHPELMACLCSVGLVLGVLGFVDDWRGLSARLRYSIHLATALLAVWLVGAVAPAWLRFPPLGLVLSLIGFTALVNMYNFMDGLDGLVAGTSAVQFSFLAFWTGRTEWLLIASAFAGFLIWNFPPARIFMGDVGSTTLGAFAATAVLASWREVPALHWIVALPLVGDAIYTIVRRLLRSENLAVAHHSHIYQRLLRSGWSHRVITLWYVGLSLACGLLPTVMGAPGGLIGGAICVALVFVAERRFKRLGVPFTRPAAPSA
jgi:Fuc2NAc and GlcNAc transferase